MRMETFLRYLMLLEMEIVFSCSIKIKFGLYEKPQGSTQTFGEKYYKYIQES